MTYEEFRPQTLSLLRRYYGVLGAFHSMEDLVQESWIAFLETGKRYTAQNNAHFFSLYKKLLKTRMMKLCRSVADLRQCDAEIQYDHDEPEDFASIIPDDGMLTPEVEAMLSELPFDLRLAMLYDIHNTDEESKRRLTTEAAFDEAAGMTGAAKMLKEALQ